MFFGGHGGFGGQQEETTPKGHDVYADLYVTLKDLYLGKEIKVTRDKAVIKPASGKRQCKCKMVMKTKQLGELSPPPPPPLHLQQSVVVTVTRG